MVDYVMSPNTLARYRDETATMTPYLFPKTQFCTVCNKRHTFAQFASVKSTICKRMGGKLACSPN